MREIHKLFFQQESGICDVVDPMVGSHLVEAWLNKWLKKRRNIQTKLEPRRDGMTESNEAGIPKMRIEERQPGKQAKVGSGRVYHHVKLILKSNQSKGMLRFWTIDNTEVRKKTNRKIRKIKADRTMTKVEEF